MELNKFAIALILVVLVIFVGAIAAHDDSNQGRVERGSDSQNLSVDDNTFRKVSSIGILLMPTSFDEKIGLETYKSAGII